jgi:predicted CXXCH cytochrome family protein
MRREPSTPARSRHAPQRSAVAVVVAVAAAFTLAWQWTAVWPATVAAAGEATPTPSADASPTVSPAPTPTAEPVPSAEPTSSPTTTPDPSATPTPAATVEPPAPTDSAEPSPTLTPDASASPSELPSPTPTISYQLSPGQRDGRPVGPPFPLWKLVPLAGDHDGSTPHNGPATALDSGACAACHAPHTALAADLLTAAAPEGNLCYRCHGPGSTFDVKSAFAAAPANDSSTASYFSHAGLDCSECHNPHDMTDLRPAQSTTGWTASGDISASSGVTASLAPIERSGGNGASLTYEYELCFKCHSSAASLPTPDSAHPSWWALDVAAEFDPSAAAFHPIEAAGRNQSAQMAASLAATAPGKKWQFSLDSTLRCASCHADPASLIGATVPEAYAPAHASVNRGLLVAPYRDRQLKSASEVYDASDFALCYLCHAEQPFADPNTDPRTDADLAADTAFPYHGDHLTALTSSTGVGTSIDTPGAGPGLAICAECHFRPHSTALSYQLGDTEPVERTGYSGLVNFAPDVEGVGATPPTWAVPDVTGSGSCTLTCHGYTHSAATYLAPPSAGFTASPLTGAAGLTVTFTDLTRYADPSTDSWAWDFGDGDTSVLQQPTHTYRAGGRYTVSLTVTRTADGLSSTLTRTDYITVSS